METEIFEIKRSWSFKKRVRSQNPVEIKDYLYTYRMIIEKAKKDNSAGILWQEQPMDKN
jgi:hypothetical protein